MHKRTAVITGGSRGLGLALTTELLRSGWNTVIDSRNAINLEDVKVSPQQQGNLRYIQGDVSDINHLEEIRRVVNELGHLDLIVNNASSLGPTPLKYLLEYSISQLEQIYRVNVLAPLGILQSLKPLLQKNTKIINVTSDAGVDAYPGWGGYGSSKAALEHISAVLAIEYPDLYVYWVDPGDMQTQMHQDAFPGEDIRNLPFPEVVIPGFLKLIEGQFPSGRYKIQEMLDS